jgi:glycerol-3-phosphate dehydrogenase
MAKAKIARTATTPNPKVTSISGPSLASEGKRKQPTADVEGEIRQRAYELYIQRGFEPGHENDDWLVAEQEILARAESQQRA